MNKLLIVILSLLAVSLKAATITNWGAQFPTAVPAGSDVILMQKGGITYYFTPNQLATSLSTNTLFEGVFSPASSMASNAVANLNGKGTNATFYNLSVSNVSASKVLILNANSQVTNAEVSAADFNNFFAMGITSIVASTGIGIGTNGGSLVITNTGGVGNDTNKIGNLNGLGTNTTFYGIVTGATVRATNLFDRSNVKFWGAFGNGITDDTIALQNALNGNIGGSVFLPVGNYRITNTLWVSGNTTVYGAGRESCLVTYNTNFNGLTTTNLRGATSYGDPIILTNVTVRDLKVDMRNGGRNGVVFGAVHGGLIHNVHVDAPGSPTDFGYGIWAVNSGGSPTNEGPFCKNITVSGCLVTDVADVGIEFFGAVSCSAIGNHVTGRRGFGLLAWEAAKDCVFVGNTVTGTTNVNLFRALGVFPSDQSHIINGSVMSAWTKTTRNTFIGNTVSNCAYGIYVVGLSMTNRPTNVKFVGNTIVNASVAGVYLANCDNIEIYDNTVEGSLRALNISPTVDGYVWNSCTNIFIEGNQFVGDTANSWIYGLTGSFSRNKVRHCPLVGLTAYGWRNCLVQGNIFTDISTAGLLWPGIVFEAVSGNECVGNIITGNKATDTRTGGSKTTGHVLHLYNAANYNIVTGNSSYDAASGYPAVYNVSTGGNNIINNNIDAP